MSQAHIESARTSAESSEVFRQIVKVGKTIIPEFVITKDQENYYLNLFAYFTGAIDGDLDRTKGLLISGPVGTGKTISMKVMREMFRNFSYENTRYIVRDYFNEKVPGKVIDKYGRESFLKTTQGHLDKTKPITWYFDDFGLENTRARSYGNEQNVMEDIMLDRYDGFIAHGMKTYATTNLTVEMIEKFYGLRVRDRLRECMNYITLTGESKRK